MHVIQVPLTCFVLISTSFFNSCNYELRYREIIYNNNMLLCLLYLNIITFLTLITIEIYSVYSDPQVGDQNLLNYEQAMAVLDITTAMRWRINCLCKDIQVINLHSFAVTQLHDLPLWIGYKIHYLVILPWLISWSRKIHVFQQNSS